MLGCSKYVTGEKTMGKKIMYFMDFPLSIGGANKVLLMQANIMQKRGYETLIVIPDDRLKGHIAEYDQICEEYGLRVLTTVYSIATCIEHIAIMDVIAACDPVRQLVETFKPDLIHSTQLNITVELVARELKVPHLMNIYQADINEFLINWINVYPQYHMADSLLISERWGKGLGITSRCIRVAYEKRKTTVKSCGWEKQEAVNIISIGTLCERKNQLEIIKFVLRCKKEGRDVRLLFLGRCDNPYGEQCKKYAENNMLQDYVIFAGFVMNVEDYLCGANLLIVSSRVESYPGVIVESMANRVPVISTPVAGVPELLKDGENGFLTKGYESDDIYNTFLRFQCCQEYGKLTQIVDNAYSTYLEHHTCQVIGKQLEEYYQWIMDDYHKKNKNLLKAAELQQIFAQYMDRKELDISTAEVRRSIWFLHHVFLYLEKKNNKKVVIWGAGSWGNIFLKWVRYLGGDQIEIIGFIDIRKQGNYLGYPIVQDKDDAIKICGAIFVAVACEQDRLDIMLYLDERGKVRNKDYFMAINGPVRL